MVKIIEANTPNQTRKEIIKYLEWCREIYERQKDQATNVGDRSRYRMAEVSIENVITELNAAIIVRKGSNFRAKQNRKRGPARRVSGRVDGAQE